VISLAVPVELVNAPSGHYFALAIDPDVAHKWRTDYGTHRLDLATRAIYRIQEPSGQQWKVYLVPIRYFRDGQPRANVERAYAAMSSQFRKVFYELGSELGVGPVVPIPIAGTIVGRVEDVIRDAWPGEMNGCGTLD
jgi:hypothetical protein